MNGSSAEELDASLNAARLAERAGQWEEALAHYERALTCVRAEGDVRSAADILRRIGVVHTQRGELERAGEVYAVSLAIAEANGFTAQIASALICLANMENLQGRLTEAEEIYTRAAGIIAGIGDERLGAMVEQNLGTIANIRGDIETALQHYASALERHERLGNELSVAHSLNNMGMACVDLGRWEQAEECLDRALVIAVRLGDTSTLGCLELNRAELYLRAGQLSSARECCDRAFEIYGRIESGTALAEVYKLYGVLYREMGKPFLAGNHFSTAVDLARRSRSPLHEAEALREWALVHLAEERNREALQCLNRAHQLFTELSARRELLDLDRRLDNIESTYLRVVQAWGESIESKDHYTAGHCERVANYACMLAEAVGITGRDLTWLRMGGYLHDVGKIAVPPEVLNKPGKLTEEEFRQMQGHTTEGDAIVAELNFPWDIRPAVRWHHERWDGSGYPDGLRGEEIPLTARILCVADVYDALTTTRSYRPAMSREEALGIMERDVGRFFEPGLFALFRSLITEASPLVDCRFPAFGKTTFVAA